MKRVYGCLDYATIGHFQSILEESGISTYLKNANAHMYMGEVPFTTCAPELFVRDDTQYDEALALLKPYYARVIGETAAGQWTCPKCEEMVEESFGSCWNCETTRPA